MHHVRKPKQRKMLKPRFYSSSSEDDDMVDSSPIKWKPIMPTFPIELDKPMGKSIETNPIIDSLNAKMSNQQKLSAEVIQKEEIYNQAEMDANMKMFGCANPGRCLSKDEIKRRKDIILQIVNERLKSKLSELMGEFDERIKMNDTYESGRRPANDTHRFGNNNSDDDDSLPEAPPPPTFNTSSESSEDDLDISMTKEFELYEKEIKEKSSSYASHIVSASNGNAVSAASSVPSNAHVPILQQTPTVYQQNWQQPTLQQWPVSDQSADVTPWIPPVGPPQVMDPFPPPIESEAEQMTFMNAPLNFPILPNANQPATNGWMNPRPTWIDPSTMFANPPPATFPSNNFSVAQHSNAEWMNMGQSAPFRPSIPPQSFNAGQSAPRMNFHPRGHRPPFIRNKTVPYSEIAIRPNNAQSSVLTASNNVNVPIVSKSTYVNAILAADQKVTSSTGDYNERKRPYEQKNDKFESANNSRANDNSRRNDDSNRNSNEFDKRIDNFKGKKSRFDSPKHDRPNSRNYHSPEPTEHKKSFYVKPKWQQKSYENDTRHEKPNAKYWNTNNRDRDMLTDAKKSINGQGNVPVEWTKLCDIVDKVLGLSPNTLKDLPSSDRRVTERNEILMILSEDPGSFYAHVDKYGEQNVQWAVKTAQRILFPQGRDNDRIILAITPFLEAIRAGTDLSKVSVPLKRESRPKSTDRVYIPRRSEFVPKEWKRMCEIVDKLLEMPTWEMEKLPLTDSLIKERNDILMILSNDPEDFLLHDEKYGARNVDAAILAAKEVLCPYGERDERVRKIMARQRGILNFCKSVDDRSISRDRESSRKRSSHKSTADESRSHSIPKEWNQLCDIVDKVLETPKEVRMKMSKRDPRWEQRDHILLMLSDDPDKLESKSEQLGHTIVEWAIKSSKKILFPNGSMDRVICKKLASQRKLLQRNRQAESSNVEKTEKESKATANEEHTDTKDDINGEAVNVNNEQPNTKKRESVDKTKSATHPGDAETKTSKTDKSPSESKRRKTDKHKSSSKSKTAPVIPAVITPEVEIDEKEVWPKLCNIVDKLLDLPANAADKLESTDKRLIERNDILMILSDDPENFSKFDLDYGTTNVAWAIKAAKKLIYRNGQPNEKFADGLWKQRDAIMCAEEGPKEDTKNAAAGGCDEWICIRKIATKVFLLSCKSVNTGKKLTKEQLHQQIELLLQLSDDPDVVRSKPICKEIGEGRVEVAIAKCKHILNRMRKSDPTALVNFENLRFKMVLYSESLNQSKNIKNYDVILAEVRKIVDQKLFNEIYGQTFNKWTNEQKVERNELAILLIKDPHLLESNEKYLEMIRKTEKSAVSEIVEEVEKCLLKCEYVKEAPALVSPPIIAKIKDERFMAPFRGRKLIQRIHRLIEQFLVDPKPEVFDVRPGDDGTIDVVCADAMTFDWLKKSISELDGLWPNAKLRISKAPISGKVLDIDDLKEVKMMLKTVPTEKFSVVMKQLKKSNSKLNTDKWQLMPASFSDAKRMFVMVDLASLVELERSKREITVESGRIYFDIPYIGKDNF